MKASFRTSFLLLLAFCALFSASALWKDKWERKNQRALKKEIVKQDGRAVYKAYKKNLKKHLSVDGYFIYNNQPYFLVSDTLKEYDFIYDLVDRNGNSLIPIQASFIGTPDFALHGCVEVGKAGKVGLFHLETKTFLPPKFEFIMPDGEGHAYGYENGNWTKLSFQNGNISEKSEMPSFDLIKSCLSFRVIPQNYVSIHETSPYFHYKIDTFKSISLSSFHQFLAEFDYNIDPEIRKFSNFIPMSDFNQTYITDLPPPGSSSHRFVSWISSTILGSRGPYQSNAISIVNVDKQKRITTFTITPTSPKDEVLATIQQYNDSLITYKDESFYYVSDSILLTIHGKQINPSYFFIPSNNYIVSYSIDSLSTQNWVFTNPNLHIKRLSEVDLKDSIWIYFEQEENNNIKAYEIHYSCMPIFVLNFLKADLLAHYGYTFPNEPELRKYVKIPDQCTPTDKLPALSDIEQHNLNMIEARIKFLSKDEAAYTHPTIVEVPFEQ